MINLLPPEHKQKEAIYSRLYALVGVYVLVVFLLGLGAAGLAGYNLTTGTTINDRQQKVDALAGQRAAHKSETTKAAFIEDRIKQAATYTETRQWETVLDAVAATVPSEIQLTSIKATTSTTKAVSLVLAGQTTDRRAIVLFRQKLASDKKFTGASLQTITDATVNSKSGFTFTIECAVAATTGGTTP
jgi:Tfp pilus assembly protein PilN